MGVKVAQPKKAFAAKPTNLCFILKTYMAQRENNSESHPLTSLECHGMHTCTGNTRGQSGKHLQLTPRKNKTTPMTASEANDMSEWEQTSFWSFFIAAFLFSKSVCLESTSHLTKYSLMFWQRHSSVLRAKVGKATSLESTN